MLDTFAANAPDVRLEVAVCVVASLCDRIGDADSLLDQRFIGAEAYRFTAGCGLASTAQFLEILACARVWPPRWS